MRLKIQEYRSLKAKIWFFDFQIPAEPLKIHKVQILPVTFSCHSKLFLLIFVLALLALSLRVTDEDFYSRNHGFVHHVTFLCMFSFLLKDLNFFS